MIRLLIFLSWVVFFAFILTLLFALRRPIAIEAFGWRADLPAGAALLAFVAIAAMVAGAISLLKDVAAAPKAARARREVERREKGLAAITRGLEAIALGDAGGARREAAIATRTLKEAPVARLLAAQAAQLSGDDAAAGEALAGLLDAPETEFLALRGLYAKAMRSGDAESAEGYAARALSLRPKARWALDAVIGLALDRMDYAAAESALKAAREAKAIERDRAARGLAAVLAAKAYAAHAAGDAAAALRDAQAALAHAPGLAPAATLYARLVGESDRKKAARALADAFAVAPAPALTEALEALFSDDIAHARAAELDRLAMKNADAPEAAYARARAALLRGEAEAAREELQALLSSHVSARALKAMAEAEEALKGAAAARIWLERAATAPRDAALGVEDFFRVTTEGWRRLILEFMEEGRLAPPPLEAPAPGLAASAFPALEAPPAIDPVQEETAEPAPVDTPDTDESLDREANAARGVS